MRNKFMSVVVLLALSACGRGYAEGEKTGYIVGLETQGVIYRSWEGQLRLAGGAGATGADVWYFSLPDKAPPILVDDIRNTQRLGYLATLHYLEWYIKTPKMWSNYEVIEIR